MGDADSRRLAWYEPAHRMVKPASVGVGRGNAGYVWPRCAHRNLFDRTISRLASLSPRWIWVKRPAENWSARHAGKSMTGMRVQEPVP